MSAQTDQVPWWLGNIAVPMVFTCLGAILGFTVGRLNDWLDDRKANKVFLRAIRVELSVARGHLDGTLKDATEARDKLDKQEQVALHLVAAFQTGIYSSQVGKLKNVFDPLVIEIIQFYDRLSNLEKIKSRLTAISFELTRFTGSGGAADKEMATAADYRSSLDEVIKRTTQLLLAADTLICKLPED